MCWTLEIQCCIKQNESQEKNHQEKQYIKDRQKGEVHKRVKEKNARKKNQKSKVLLKLKEENFLEGGRQQCLMLPRS